MKTISLLMIIFCAVACTQPPTDTNRVTMINTVTPPRPAGQKDVLQLRCDPLPVVRIGIIGLGMRGPDAVDRLSQIEGAEVVALCDVQQERTQRANQILEKNGKQKALEFYGDTSVWRNVTALPNIDLIYVTTDWKSHAMIGIQAMKDGKHVVIEVPAALTMEDIWSLINTSEQTRKHCMQLENATYSSFELTTLNMIQQGLLGEILHGESGYVHNLEEFWDVYWNNWRMDYNRHHRGDIYPTHGLGPICLAMNIHRGDKLNYLVSMDTKAVNLPAYIKEKTGEEVTDFKNGQHTITMIKTEKDHTILIEHDVSSPRPYGGKFQVTGTKGIANKFTLEMEYYAFAETETVEGSTANYQDVNSHKYISDEMKKVLDEKYKYPFVREIEEKAKEVGGHGGLDYIMDYRLIYCLRNGLPLDLDVYDMAETCCLVPLTAISLDNGSVPVEIPDFTRGNWNRLTKVEFAK